MSSSAVVIVPLELRIVAALGALVDSNGDAARSARQLHNMRSRECKKKVESVLVVTLYLEDLG